MKLYSIRNWNAHYEKAQTRKVEKAQWVPLPVKHDGLSFRRLMAMPDGLRYFGAWVLLVEVAAKCSPRGVLQDERGPLTPADLAIKTGASADDFIKALDVLTSELIGWVEVTETNGGSPATIGALISDTTPAGSPEPIPLPLHDIQVGQVEQTPRARPLIVVLAEVCCQDIERCDERMRARFSRAAERLLALEPEMTKQDIATMLKDFGDWHAQESSKHPIPVPEWIPDKWGPFKARGVVKTSNGSGELSEEARKSGRKPDLPGVWVYVTGYGWMDESGME